MKLSLLPIRYPRNRKDKVDLKSWIVNFLSSLWLSLQHTYTVSGNEKIKQQDSILTGYLRYREVITLGNKSLFINHCGMKKHVFQLLLRKLTSPMGGLTDGTKIGSGEKIMIFLSIMRGNTYRDTVGAGALIPYKRGDDDVGWFISYSHS